jgi:hypothetical protein
MTSDSTKYRIATRPDADDIGVADLPEPLRLLATAIKASTSMALAGGADPQDVARLFLGLAESVRLEPRADITPETLESVHAASQLTQCWSTESEFLDTSGKPKALPVSGRKASFAALVRRTGGFRNSREALTALERHRAARSDGKTVTLLSRTVITNAATPEARARAWMSSLGHLTTITQNVSDRPHEEKLPERTVTSLRFPVSALPALRAAVEEQGDVFLRFLDQLMKEHEDQASSRGEPTEAVGVGFWQFRVPVFPEATQAPVKRRRRTRK